MCNMHVFVSLYVCCTCLYITRAHNAVYLCGMCSKDESCNYAMAHRVCASMWSWRANMTCRMCVRYTSRRVHVHVDACVLNGYHVWVTVLLIYCNGEYAMCVYITFTYAVHIYHENVPYLWKMFHRHVAICQVCIGRVWTVERVYMPCSCSVCIWGV